MGKGESLFSRKRLSLEGEVSAKILSGKGGQLHIYIENYSHCKKCSNSLIKTTELFLSIRQSSNQFTFELGNPWAYLISTDQRPPILTSDWFQFSHPFHDDARCKGIFSLLSTSTFYQSSTLTLLIRSFQK